MRHEGALLGLRPQADAGPGPEAAGAAPPLFGGRDGNRPGHQPLHAGTRIEGRDPFQSAVDHHGHAFDGQAGFGDIGRQHDFSRIRRRRRDGTVLRRKLHVAVQPVQGDAGRQ